MIIAIELAIGHPYLGISVAPGESGVKVVSVAKDSPFMGLVDAGDELFALSSESQTFRFKPIDALAEPDDVSRFSTYNDFFNRQHALWQRLQNETLVVEVERERKSELTGQQPDLVRVTLDRKSGIWDLSVSFWYQVFCGLTVFWLGMAAWAFAQSEYGPRFYAIAGFGLCIAIVASAVYTTRSVSLPPDLFLNLSRANQFGAMLFAGAGTTLLWYYPTRIGSFRFERFMFPAVLLILTINWNQWIESVDIIARMTLIGWVMIDLILAVIQWQRTISEPVSRARLKWFVYAWFSGVLGYLGLVVVPQLFGRTSFLQQQYAWGLFVLTYVGIALGIVRYRLFDLDRWILMGWFWFACGLLILVLDGVFVIWLNMQQELGLALSLVLVSWIYFPARQLFITRVFPRNRQEQLWQKLSQTLGDAFDASSSLEKQWQRVLRQSFDPLFVNRSDHSPSESRLLDHGLRMTVSHPSGVGGVELSYADQGGRLFDRSDLDFANRAGVLFGHVRQYRNSFIEGVRAERARVARDLHDDVGARLLSVIYQAEGSLVASKARECLQELRGVIQGLQRETVPLSQSISRWRDEVMERCDLSGLDVVFEAVLETDQCELSPRAERNLTSIVREWLSNVLKHACARQACLRLEVVDACLTLELSDNGNGWPSGITWDNAGVGMLSMRERCEELGGELRPYSITTSGAGLALLIPLQADKLV